MTKKQRILVSACLLGQEVRSDGGHALNNHRMLAHWQSEGRIVPFCPECAAGLPTPREPAEILNGRVMTPSGEDFTDDFSRGAELALKLCLNQGIKLAVLKENSPSCGSTFIYDGQFTGTKISGQGMAARTLRKNGIRVFSEDQLEKAAHWLESIS